MLPGIAGIAGAPLRPPSPVLEVIATDDGFQTGNRDTFNINNLAIGDPAVDRYIVAGVGVAVYGGGPTVVVDSVTLNGVSATEVFEHSNQNLTAAFYILHFPFGGEVDAEIDVTKTGTSNACSIQLWSVRGLGSTTPSHTKGADDSSDAVALTTSCNAKSVILSAFSFNSYPTIPGTTSWANATEVSDFVSETYTVFSAAHDIFDTAQTNRAITATSSVTISDKGAGASISLDGVETP